MSISSGYGQITGLVFEDLKANGLLDKKDGGLGGIVVQLVDVKTKVVLDTATTDFNGAYTFTDVPAKHQYQVKFLNPDQDNFRFSKSSPDIQDAFLSRKFIVKPEQTISKINAGLYQSAKIGDRVFLDMDADGRQDQGEAGLGGIKIQLLNNSGKVLESTVSNAQGDYLFSDLRPGKYQVQFEDKEGYHFSPRRKGKDPSVDSDGPHSRLIWLKSGEWNDKIDAGLFKKATVGDRVWLDEDSDGIQDASEPGIGGVTVKLTRPNGTVLQTMTTDADGNYLFDDVRPGQYRVMFNNPDTEAFEFTTANVGNNDNIDSDANVSTGQTSVFRLKSGQKNLTIDAGLKTKQSPDPAKLGDFVFNDLNQNGIQDAGEPGIAGATVKLQNPAGTTLETTTTDAQGMYLFNDLTPGDYKVMFVQPNGFDSVSPFEVGGNTAIDSDANPNNGLMSDVVNLSPGEFDSTIDAGFFQSQQPGIDIEKLVRVTSGGDGQPGLDVCETAGKPEALTFTYIPNLTIDTNQKPGRVEFENTPTLDDDNEVFVVTKNFSGTVSVGEEFTFSASGGDLTFEIFDFQGGPLLQEIEKYHLSCSDAITLGDQLGSLTLTGYQGEDGSVSLPEPTDFVDADTTPGPEVVVNSQVEFQYIVTNTGDTALSDIQVIDDRLANVVFEAGDDNGNNLLDLNETWIYSASEQATGEGLVTNKGTVTGVGNGVTVMDMDVANYTVVKPPALAGDVCDVLGKPEALTFTYRSDDDSSFSDIITNQKSDKAVLVGNPDDDGLGYVVVSNGKFKSGKSKSSKGGKSKSSKGGKGSSIFFEGAVSAGDVFSASGDFKSETLIQVFEDETAFNSGAAALQTIEYHTSCSQPIQIGDQLGSVLLSGYQGEDGSTGLIG